MRTISTGRWLGTEATRLNAVALALAIAFISCGCSEHCSRSSAESGPVQPEKNKGILCVIQEIVFDVDRWKVWSETQVRGDGSYVWIVNDIWGDGKPDKQTGQLPASIVWALANDAASRDVFSMVKNVPTYEYGVDDSKTKHPESVKQVLEFVRRPLEQKPLGGAPNGLKKPSTNK